jgi:competence protein ComEC
MAMKKKTVFWLLLSSMIIFFTLFLLFLDASLPDGKLHISYLNIGQGDSILVTTPKGKHVLIDGGPFSNILEVLPAKLGYFNHTIDLLVLTHPHSDHLEGLLEVLKRYTVPAVLYSGIKSQGDEYKAFLEMIDDKQVLIADPQKDIEVESGVFLNIVSPAEKGKFFPLQDANDSSLVFRLEYGKTRILFTGDMTADLENTVLLSGVDIVSDVLKIAHHGSRYSSTPQFISAVSPAVGVISVGKNNRFKHPSFQTLALLQEDNIQTYRTDEQGTIDMVCGNHTDCVVTTETHPKVFENAKNVLSN